MNPTGRIPPAEPVSTGNIRLGTWTFSYGGLTVCIRRRDSGLARYFVPTVGRRLWATVPSSVVMDLCSQRSNCVAGSLLVASTHIASRWRSVVGEYYPFYYKLNLIVNVFIILQVTFWQHWQCLFIMNYQFFAPYEYNYYLIYSKWNFLDLAYKGYNI